ncbi:MAG: hypothetical protein ACT4QE_05365 [Anaerolineales bacterium]
MNSNNDLITLKQMTDELEEYLLSEVEFWPLSGSSDFPKLSLGTYLLARQRLTTAPVTAELTALREKGAAILEQWRSNAEKKAEKELHTRVRLWQNFVDEGRGRYATEVAQRTMAGLLLGAFPRLSQTPDGQRLAALDARVRGKYPADPFVWDADLQSAFPASEFWFLYLKGPSA